MFFLLKLEQVLEIFLSNLSEPWSSINSALQGNFKNTGNTLARFIINSTLGILGIFDVAKEVGFEKQKKTLDKH